MHKAHETIWLQVDPDGESYDPEQWILEDDATWCKDQINANDIKYVRADIAEAELEAARAEIEQLMAYNETRTAEVLAATQRLAAEQAKNVELREALESAINGLTWWMDNMPQDVTDVDFAEIDALQEALAAPSDTSALEAIVKKAGEVMRRWATDQEMLKGHAGPLIVVYAIRALPAVTLDDLKGGA